MPITVEKFISGFEEKFGNYLQPAQHLAAQNSQVISHSVNFSVIHPKQKSSDWDLECHLKSDTVDSTVLKEMYEYVHDFTGFENVGDFIGNQWFQFMAFLTGEKEGPFVDIHIQDVPDDLWKWYHDNFLNLESARQETVDWLVITWFRKLKNGVGKKAEDFKNYWLFSRGYLTEKECRLLKEVPQEFPSRYLAGRGYENILNFLNS